jgi:hypothetical protein
MRVRIRFGSNRHSCRRLVKTVALVALDSPMATEALHGPAITAATAAGRSGQPPLKPRPVHTLSTCESALPSKATTPKLSLPLKITVPTVQSAAPLAKFNAGQPLLARDTLHPTSGSNERR